MINLTFIRHTSVDVPPGVCYGQTDVPLASSFPEEGEAVKTRLNGMRFDAVFSSPLTRCVRLANLCGYPCPTLDPRLMEMNFGEWEMKRYDEISDPRLQEWYADYLNVAATGGESSMQQRRRLESFLADLKKRGFSSGSHVAIFTHGGIMIHALAILANLTYEEAYRHQPLYGSLLRFPL